jgi:hypothetical protein
MNSIQDPAGEPAPALIAGVAAEASVSPYAGTPGLGPPGKTCRMCNCLQHGAIGRREKSHPFCRLVADRMGPARTEHRPKVWTGKNACEHYRPISGFG